MSFELIKIQEVQNISNRKRDKTITIRVTESERKRILAKADKSQMNLTEYLIACSDDANIYVAEDLKPIVSELKKIGNNLNQIAMKINSGAVRSYNFSDIISLQTEIYNEVYEIADACCRTHPRKSSNKNGNGKVH